MLNNKELQSQYIQGVKSLGIKLTSKDFAFLEKTDTYGGAYIENLAKLLGGKISN